jgi:hypothetical protein
LTQGPLYDVPFEDFPIPSTEYIDLYLRDNGKLSASPQDNENSVSHVADSYQATPSQFALIFDQATTLVGHSKAEIYVSSDETDDLDVYVSIRKLSAKGEVLEHVNVPWEALPKGVNTQHDVPMAQTVKVSHPEVITTFPMWLTIWLVHGTYRYPAGFASGSGPQT